MSMSVIDPSIPLGKSVACQDEDEILAKVGVLNSADVLPQDTPPRPVRDYLIFTVCAILYLIPFMRLLLGTDEGLFAYGAVRVSEGQVFGRDFFEIVGPGTFYWVALFFKLLGVTFFAARACLFVTSLGTAILIFALSRRVCVRYQALACLLIASASFGLIWPTISHHVDSNCAALLSVFLITTWLDKGERSRLWAAGAAAGLTACFHLPKGVLVFVALSLWLIVQRQRRPHWLRNVANVTAGFGLVLGGALLYFWSQHAARDVINAIVLWPSQHYGGVNQVAYANGLVNQYWDAWAGMGNGLRWSEALAVLLIIPLVVIAALPLLLPLAGLLDRTSFGRPEVSLFWIAGWAIWYSEFHRRDIYHLVFGAPLLAILLVYYLQRSPFRFGGAALQVLLVSSSCLTLANLGVTMGASSIETRVGAVHSFRRDPVLGQMLQRIPVGEEILIYPSNPEYYFLTATKNPIRYGGLMYNYNSPAEFQRVVDILDEHKVRHVVWDTEFMARSQKTMFPSAIPPAPDQLIVEAYLELHYKTIWEDGGVKIMERKEQDDAGTR